MRSTFVAVTLLLGLSGAFTRSAAAQTTTPTAQPTIHRVTLDESAGVLTLTGTGLGAELFVTVEGHPVAVLPGASATQLEVLAPATLLSTPGTYRLTVLDPARRAGEAFVFARGAVSVVSGGAAPEGPRVAAAGTGTPGGSPSAPAAHAPSPLAGPAPLTVIEDMGAPFRTAIGYRALVNNLSTSYYNTASGYTALANNTMGEGNTASGYEALYNNTTGTDNTASGSHALLNNSTGSSNTASGSFALYANTTGFYNTASGYEALYVNKTGYYNTANGYQALLSNNSGQFNTASGAQALYFNTTGGLNTATGYRALFANTIGGYNTASGLGALHDNTIGSFNTADGYTALYANTTGNSNTASGYEALRFNTTGSSNTASGNGALYSNSTGVGNTVSGVNALYVNSTGSNNTALGLNAGNGADGSYNVFVGANVQGTSADANTMRLGLPYSGGVGQNRTFIAGIHGTQLTGGYLQVVVDANGQLGTLTPPVQLTGGPASLVTPAALEQQVQAQQAINTEQQATIAELASSNADLRARLARLEALLAAGARRR